jgi:hypothetical protein
VQQFGYTALLKERIIMTIEEEYWYKGLNESITISSIKEYLIEERAYRGYLNMDEFRQNFNYLTEEFCKDIEKLNNACFNTFKMYSINHALKEEIEQKGDSFFNLSNEIEEIVEAKLNRNIDLMDKNGMFIRKD